MTTYVYWYHLPEHLNSSIEGYIGVTRNLKERHWHHSTGRTNQHLANAFIKHNNIIKDILFKGTRKECLQLEINLRPVENIGWNICKGGGDAPDCTGRKHSQETKSKISKGNIGKGISRISKFKGITNRHSKEMKTFLGSFHKGKTISQAHKLIIAERHKGANSPNACTITLVNIAHPSNIHVFDCIKTAADALNISYNTIRSQAQKVIREDVTSDPSRNGWVCLNSIDAANPIGAVERSITARSKRMRSLPKACGKNNHKSQTITLENTEGALETFESINKAALHIKLSEATLRYHVKQSITRKQDSSFNKQGWKVKYY